MSPTVTPTLGKANTEQLAQGRGVFGRAADRADPCLRLSVGLVYRVHTGWLPRRLSALSLIPSSILPHHREVAELHEHDAEYGRRRPRPVVDGMHPGHEPVPSRRRVRSTSRTTCCRVCATATTSALRSRRPATRLSVMAVRAPSAPIARRRGAAARDGSRGRWDGRGCRAGRCCTSRRGRNPPGPARATPPPAGRRS